MNDKNTSVDELHVEVKSDKVSSLNKELLNKPKIITGSEAKHVEDAKDSESEWSDFFTQLNEIAQHARDEK